MTGDADELKTALLTRIEAASDLKELDDVRVEALGKKGRITEQMKGMQRLKQSATVLPAPDQPDPGRDHRDLW